MFNLKRTAFTLAEVLIALGLVGILSAVAIQTMKQNDHAAEFEALKNKSVMNVQASMHDAMYKAKAGEIITEGDASIDSLKTKVEDALVSKGEKTFHNAYIFEPAPDIGKTFKGMRDGVYFAIDKNGLADTGAVARVAIDVNAEAAPNKDGMDQALLYMDKYGNLGVVPPPPSTPPVEDEEDEDVEEDDVPPAGNLEHDVGNPDAEKPKDRGFQDKEKPQFNIDVF